MLKAKMYFMFGMVLLLKIIDIFILRKDMDNNVYEIGQESQKKLPFNNLFLNVGVVDGQNKLWMYIFGLAFIAFAYLIVGGIMLLPLFQLALDAGVTTEEIMANQYIIFNPDKLHINKNIILLTQFGLFVAAFIAFVIVIRYVHKKRLLSVITGYESFRYKKFFFAFGLWTVIMIISLFVSLLSTPDELTLQFDLAKFIQLFIVCLVFLPIQTLTEEMVFRGYLMQGFSQIFKNGYIPLILTSGLFAAAHMSNPETSAYGSELMFTYYMVFALFLGGLTLLSEGLELAFGIHLANNLLSALLITSKNSVLKTDAVFYTTSEDAASELVLAVCALLAVSIVFWITYKWKNLNLIIK